jgi:alpha-galactosidase
MAPHVGILNEGSLVETYENFWGHNDLDMLEIGDGDLLIEDSQTLFAFWAATKSLLIIGTELDTLASEYVTILKNPYLLNF